jgi:hypothetical protein
MDQPSGKPMRQSSEKLRHLSEKHRQLSDAGSRVAAFLRARHPQRTADNVAAETGLKSATIAKWLERESAPNGVAMLVLVAVYGPDFLGAAMSAPPAWLSAPMRAAHAELLLAELEDIRARIAVGATD